MIMACACMFTSCKNKEKCWKVTVDLYGDGGSYYAWGTEEEIQTIIDDLEDDARDYDADFDAQIKEVDKSEGDCEDKEDLEDLKYYWRSY